MIPLKDLKKGNYIMHRGEPAIIKEMGIAVTGTHSHTKCKATVQGIFSNFTDTIIASTHETVEELLIIRKRAQLLAKHERMVQIMDPVSYETLDAEIDPDLLVQLHEGDEVTYIPKFSLVFEHYAYFFEDIFLFWL